MTDGSTIYTQFDSAVKKKMPLRDHHLQLIIAGNSKGGGRGRGRETILVTNFRLSLNPIKI